jgi:hypothetical protein
MPVCGILYEMFWHRFYCHYASAATAAGITNDFAFVVFIEIYLK